MHRESGDVHRLSPLGREVAYDSDYDPGLLFPIARDDSRAGLGLDASSLPFTGCDVWNAWELSWLDGRGKPVVARARLHLPAASTNIVESKSLKLYLNSLNQTVFSHPDEVAAVVTRDLSAAAGARVGVEIALPEAGELPSVAIPGECLDSLPVSIRHYQAEPSLLRPDPRRGEVEETLHTHLLRSLCPVTAQPDWGSVMIRYRGQAVDRGGLLAYIISFRQHQDYHEHCVERMFVDIRRALSPQQLTVEARYLRRGGLDINPFRSSRADAAPVPGRWYRQ